MTDNVTYWAVVFNIETFWLAHTFAWNTSYRSVGGWLHCRYPRLFVRAVCTSNCRVMGKEENARTNTIFHMFWRLSNINGCVESGWQEWISNKIWKGRNQGAGTMLTQLSEFHFKVKLVFSPRDIFALHSTLFHFQKEPGRGRNIFLSDHWGSILWQTFVKIWVFRPKSDHRLTLSRTHQLTHLLMLLRLHWRDLALASDDC